MDLGQQRYSGYWKTVQQMFGCNKSAWVGAVPEAATPALAWPPSLCPCPLRRCAARLSGCSVAWRSARLSRAQARWGARPASGTPQHEKSKPRAPRRLRGAQGWVFSSARCKGELDRLGRSLGRGARGWRGERPGAARCPLLAAPQGPGAPASPRSAACFVFELV